ncbi:MAG: M48 family metallopeptidase [Kiritimatiellae bacterium]|nr:M48 family metallopeptidase [Kiritimatiellia bacterium]
MCNVLSKAQNLAEKVRFIGDSFRHSGIKIMPKLDLIRSLSYTNELNISQDVTPSLFESLSKVYNRLHIPRDAVEAFVFASPVIQAECYAGNQTECVIRFSSALIDILNSDEFEFVAGHEIGHFLLDHGLIRTVENQQSLEFFIQQRAQEISVDRIGLLACGSLNIAIKALMKTVSGLTDNHLRFDVGTFLSQLHKSSSISLNVNNESTHPSILIRCRALLWFSLNDYFIKNSKNISTAQLINIDKKIKSDLDKHVDRAARRRIQEVKEDLSMWMAVYDIVQDGVFTKNEQVEFSKRFSKDTLNRLLSFLENISSSEVKTVVYERLKVTKEDLKSLIPTSFESEVAAIRK